MDTENCSPEFLLRVRNEVYHWFNRKRDLDTELTDVWTHLDEVYVQTFLKNMCGNVDDPEDWWRRGGSRYARKAVRKFASRLNKVGSGKANAAHVEQAYLEAEAELNEALERLAGRLGRSWAPVLCPAEDE